MLKLEKTRSREIHVCLRSRQRVFSRSFIYAFLIALALHLGGFLMFHVRTLFIKDKGSFPPIVVEADLSGELYHEDSEALALLGKKEAPHYRLAPHISDPSIPSLAIEIPKRDHVFAAEEVGRSNPFLEIEEDPEHVHKSIPNKHRGKPFVMHVSGPLAEIPLLDDGFNQMSSEISALCTRFSAGIVVRYEVRVENQTGRIFWHMLKQAPDHLAGIASKILEKMRFQQDDRHFVTSGEIEFNITEIGS